VSNLSAIAWQDQVIFRQNDDIHFVLDQSDTILVHLNISMRVDISLHSIHYPDSSSLKHQYEGRHLAPLDTLS